MIRLSPKDSSILTRITSYQRLPLSERKELLQQASATAQQVGAIILGLSPRAGADPDIVAAADAYLKWLDALKRWPPRGIKRRG